MFRQFAVILFAGVLASCGADNGAGSKPEDQVTTTSERQEPSEQVQGTSVPGHALAVTELPDCNDGNLHQLVYLKTDETFYTCADDWQPIQIATETKVVEVQNDMLWHDEVTDRHWFFRTLTNSWTGCGGSGFFEPSLEDIQEALANGLFEGVSVNIYYAANKYINSRYPDRLDTTYSASLFGFSLCYVK